VDLIKPSKQMRDASDSKAYSTKSSKAKKGSKEAANNNSNSATNQRHKKSNASSSNNSRGKNAAASSRESHEDIARKTTLVKEFLGELIEKACDIAAAEE